MTSTPSHSAIFGDPAGWPERDLIGLSRDLSITMTLEAYRVGVFPMPVVVQGKREIAWFSPMQRGILPLDGMRVTRSLRKMTKRYRVTFDRAFSRVVSRCADPSREGRWIDDQVARIYGTLHRRGLAHSVECWDSDRKLVGGLYGVAMGGLFAGESMFHDPVRGRDASKVALAALVERLSAAGGDRLLDVQWRTDHLGSLGVIEVERPHYLSMLAETLKTPALIWR